jgi:hypothetical protein
MIYEFGTAAGGRITYTDVVGSQLLHVIGKSPGPRGVIMVEEIPGALERIDAAIARERERLAEERQALEPHAPKATDEDEAQRPVVPTLAQRAFPFVELLRFALRERENVTWGI